MEAFAILCCLPWFFFLCQLSEPFWYRDCFKVQAKVERMLGVALVPLQKLLVWPCRLRFALGDLGCRVYTLDILLQVWSTDLIFPRAAERKPSTLVPLPQAARAQILQMRQELEILQSKKEDEEPR